jgi:hypothetical protein
VIRFDPGARATDAAANLLGHCRELPKESSGGRFRQGSSSSAWAWRGRDHIEVPPVQGGDPDSAVPFGQGDHGGVGAAQGHAGVGGD